MPDERKAAGSHPFLYTLAGACAIYILSLAGCENRYVNQYDYERIAPGMPMEQVQDLIGKPSRREGDEFCYEGEYGTIRIKANNDRVETKEWVNKR